MNNSSLLIQGKLVTIEDTIQPLTPKLIEASPKPDHPNFKDRSTKSKYLFTENILFKIKQASLNKYAINQQTIEQNEKNEELV